MIEYRHRLAACALALWTIHAGTARDATPATWKIGLQNVIAPLVMADQQSGSLGDVVRAAFATLHIATDFIYFHPMAITVRSRIFVLTHIDELKKCRIIGLGRGRQVMGRGYDAVVGKSPACRDSVTMPSASLLSHRMEVLISRRGIFYLSGKADRIIERY